MIKVTILYPNAPDATFDMKYYVTKHMPMVRDKCAPACLSIAAESGIAGGEPGSPPLYRAGEQREPDPGEPVAEVQISRAVVARGYVGHEGRERRRVAGDLGEDAAAVVAHGQIALLRGAHDAEPGLDAAHHRHVAVPGSIEDEVPRRHQHQRHAGCAVVPR